MIFIFKKDINEFYLRNKQEIHKMKIKQIVIIEKRADGEIIQQIGNFMFMNVIKITNSFDKFVFFSRIIVKLLQENSKR
jgi:hypothetical protein